MPKGRLFFLIFRISGFLGENSTFHFFLFFKWGNCTDLTIDKTFMLDQIDTATLPPGCTYDFTLEGLLYRESDRD